MVDDRGEWTRVAVDVSEVDADAGNGGRRIVSGTAVGEGD